MPWFRVDDNLAFHHKVVAAGNAAMGLWVRAGSMCSAQLTDGFVPDHMISSLGGKTQAKRLVEVGLWIREDDGYRFHEWAERQPSAADVKAAAEKQGQSGSLGNHRRWHLRKGVTNPDCEHCKVSGNGRKPDRVPDAPPESVPNRPSRPVPSRPDKDVSDGDGKPSAQPLIGEWIEHCTERPPGRVVGQVSKEIKAMLSEGIPAERVRVGLAEWQRKGLHASTLPSVVHEVASRAQPAARERPHVSEIEQPPDGLTDEQYRDWWQKRRRA